MLRPPIVIGDVFGLPKFFLLSCHVPFAVRLASLGAERLALTPLALPALPTIAGGMFIFAVGPPAPGKGIKSKGASDSAKAATLS